MKVIKMSTRNQIASAARQVSMKSESGLQTIQELAIHDSSLNRAKHCVERGDFDGALSALRDWSKDPLARNDMGVCLMRQGRHEEAAKLFRDLIYEPGAIWIRPHVSANLRINCATALLLTGHPAGCLDTIVDLDPGQQPRVQEIQDAIRRWEKTLSWWSRLNWWLGRIEPPKVPIALDFVLGEFELIRPDGQ